MLMKKKKIVRNGIKLTPLLEFIREEYKPTFDIPEYFSDDSRCMICKLDSYWWQCSPYRKHWCEWVNRGLKTFIYVA